MAIEHFTWRIKASSQPTLGSRDTVHTAQFDDDYKQVSDARMNNETLSYEFLFTDEPETVKDIYSLLWYHKTKSFSFALPGGNLVLWRVETDSLQRVTKSKTMETISVTFEQAFAP